MNSRHQQNGQIYLEFHTLGSSQKATAICSVTHVEVTVVGPIKATREHMSQLAVKKLKWRIEQLAN